MEPYITADRVRLALSTAAAILDARGPSWTLMACHHESDCGDGDTCVSSDHILPGWCVNASAVLTTRTHSPNRADQFPAVSAFVFGVIVCISLLVQCARRAIPSDATATLQSLRKLQ